jgi:hypothetical protein
MIQKAFANNKDSENYQFAAYAARAVTFANHGKSN